MRPIGAAVSHAAKQKWDPRGTLSQILQCRGGADDAASRHQPLVHLMSYLPRRVCESRPSGPGLPVPVPVALHPLSFSVHVPGYVHTITIVPWMSSLLLVQRQCTFLNWGMSVSLSVSLSVSNNGPAQSAFATEQRYCTGYPGNGKQNLSTRV